MDPQFLVARCVDYFIQLVDSKTNIDDNVTHACNTFLSKVGGHMPQEIAKILEQAFKKDKVESELFKKYVQELKGSITVMF